MALGLPEEVKASYDVSRVRKLMISSAPARKDTKLAILEYFPNSQLYELYGSSEAGWVTLLRPDEQIDHLGSVGREWTGSGPVKILDPEGNEVPDGEVGELFSCTPYTFDGYLNDPVKTAESIRGDGYCSVGDMARRDEQGFIHLVDRKSNMIISGGENIYPSEIENILGRYPGREGCRGRRRSARKMGRGRARGDRHARRGSPPSRRTCSTGAATRWRATSGRARYRSSPRARCRARRPARSCIACCATSWPAGADRSCSTSLPRSSA